MKKSLKKFQIVLLIVVILVVAVIMAIDFFADVVLKTGIELSAMKSLNVGVSVDDVELSFINGRVVLQNLVINNPPGYKHKKLLILKNAEIQVNTRSLLTSTVNIKTIALDGVDIVLEQKGISGNNLQEIISSIPAKEKKTKPTGKKLHVDNLEITNVTVKIKLLPVPGKADTITLKLSPIRMTDLGRNEDLDTAKLSSRILLAIASGVTEQGVDVLPTEIVETMKLTVDKTIGLGEAVAEEGKKIIDTGKDVIESGKDIGKGITEGFKSLLKPGKDDK